MSLQVNFVICHRISNIIIDAIIIIYIFLSLGYKDYGLPLDEVTIADKLKDVGYKTYMSGKWHLGLYNWESTPIARGFDKCMGYWNGAEDHLTHEQQNYLDFHKQNSTGPSGHEFITNGNNIFGTSLFVNDMSENIKSHKLNYPNTPGFFYLPLQNVHVPLQSPGEKYDNVCNNIPNSDRRTFCSMATIADEAIGNITSLIKTEFKTDKYLVIIAGDNGGIPTGAGNNFPLRGHKAEFWEGGVRNNALLWGSVIPSYNKGSTYTNGLINIVDIHEIFSFLGQTKLKSKNNHTDGLNTLWFDIINNKKSSRTEFLIGYDPCSGHGRCTGVAYGYRLNDMKYLSGIRNDTWYPVPTEMDVYNETTLGIYHDEASGSVYWLDDYNFNNDNEGVFERLRESNSKTNTPVAQTHHHRQLQYPPSPTPGNTVECLFNITADPYEKNNLVTDTKYANIIKIIQNKVQAIVNGSDYLAPCNIPGGICNTDDESAANVLEKNGGWYPWKN